jgi:hypothetical protein
MPDKIKGQNLLADIVSFLLHLTFRGLAQLPITKRKSVSKIKINTKMKA